MDMIKEQDSHLFSSQYNIIINQQVFYLFPVLYKLLMWDPYVYIYFLLRKYVFPRVKILLTFVILVCVENFVLML